HAQEDTSPNDPTAKPFHPRFTYPIFGEDEKIYGYNDLVINLSLASGSLAMCFTMKHSAKLPASTVDDVEGTLYKFIPSDYLKNEDTFRANVEKEALTFRPPGTKVFSYARPSTHGDPSSSGKGKSKAQTDGAELDEESPDVSVFEAYHCKWETPGFRDLHRRMQLFILLYIEAGSYIQEDEDKWEFVVLYERRRRRDGNVTYHFVGYTSMYPFFYFPDKVRMRLSQFVLAGPYQGQGHGALLYTALYQYCLSQDQIAELAIEDPSEAFEDLRDKTDLRMLFKNAEFMKEAYGDVDGTGLNGKLGPPADKEWVVGWQKKLKMAGRQWERLIEMLILRRLDPTNPALLKAYRLQVKDRLYRFNFEILVILDKQERLEKLEETFNSVIEGYSGILGMIEG
ncbi:histone acetyltransferase type B, partial [Clavulina sp. PMI_390]